MLVLVQMSVSVVMCAVVFGCHYLLINLGKNGRWLFQGRRREVQTLILYQMRGYYLYKIMTNEGKGGEIRIKGWILKKVCTKITSNKCLFFSIHCVNNKKSIIGLYHELNLFPRNPRCVKFVNTFYVWEDIYVCTGW